MSPPPGQATARSDGAHLRVSVVLPVHRVDRREGLARAVSSITGQSLAEIEILLIANGSDAGTLDVLSAVAASDARARVIVLPAANLAAALNEGLRVARAELVARMDADDWSHPDRLAIQRAYLTEHPEVAAVGSSWDRVTAGGGRERVAVPTDPRELRWRLLLENPLAHGSMMLRRSMVRAVGGYDPACTRAQDYDLWLRLAREHPIAAVPEVLYEYTARHVGGREESHADQSLTAAWSLVRAWTSLPGCSTAALERLAGAIGPALGGQQPGDRELGEVEAVLRESGPSAAALTAWLWACWRRGAAGAGGSEICRLARVREVVGQMAAAGATGLWLWGAGRHTAWLLSKGEAIGGLSVVGVVDDHAAGQTRGRFTVQRPESIPDGAWVLISSDGFEEEIWRSAENVRGRGVHVVRIYGENPGRESGGSFVR